MSLSTVTKMMLCETRHYRPLWNASSAFASIWQC